MKLTSTIFSSEPTWIRSAFLHLHILCQMIAVSLVESEGSIHTTIDARLQLCTCFFNFSRLMNPSSTIPSGHSMYIGSSMSPSKNAASMSTTSHIHSLIFIIQCESNTHSHWLWACHWWKRFHVINTIDLHVAFRNNPWLESDEAVLFQFSWLLTWMVQRSLAWTCSPFSMIL